MDLKISKYDFMFILLLTSLTSIIAYEKNIIQNLLSIILHSLRR